MKNKKKIMLLPLLALMSLTVVSCGEKTSDSSSSSKASDTEKQSASDSESKKEEVKYQVSFNKSDKVTVSVNGLEENKALPGSEVSFTVSSEEEEVLSVDSSLAHLDYENGVYYFTMPNKDVTIDIASEAYGDPSILDIKDVDVTSLPNNVASVASYLEKSMAVEGTYFSSAHVVNNNFLGQYAWYDYSVKAGKNDVLLISGHKKNYASDAMSTYYSREIGKENNIYYTITSTTLLGSSSNTINHDYAFKTVIADDAESVGVNQIKASDAKTNYSSYQGASVVYDSFFSDKSTIKFQDYPENPQNYNYYLKDIEKTLSDDKKSVRLDLTGIYTSWAGTQLYKISMEFDGDNFMNNLSISQTNYDSDDCDSTTKLPLDGKTGQLISSYELEMTRGYKSTLEKTAISDFAMDSYDVAISYTINGDEKKTDSKDVIVENGSTLKFSFSSNDDKSTFIEPTLKRVKEGDGYVDLDELKVEKEGEFTLVFDNGFGKEKEVMITSVKPKAESISVSAPSKVFLNENASMTVSVLPEKANQDVTFTKKDTSTGDAEIKKNDDGTYTIKGLKLGEVSYTVTSDENSEISEDFTFNVVEKPSATEFKNNVLTKTFYGESSDHKAVANFNEDGTGKFKTATNGLYSFYEEEKSFAWTFDEATLTFTISGAEGSYYKGRGFLTFAAETLDEAVGSFIEYNYSGDETRFTVSMTAQDRKDLSDFS